ncbi:restriction endonuclease subunit S [Paucilactobacillus kaifaensis]|uniref:restriction endonuclease subunit S n=1 Tax=Paucilactobacillus kaifaensis TaxID=2559921 RepID=UPI0010F8132E|nr:restriction endonuclease subunit S [Paucilactobacillus kaifaensis]
MKIKSYSLSRNFETNKETGVKYIHYGDIHTGIADCIRDVKELPNIIDDDYEKLKSGDVIVADASEDYKGIAEASVLLNTANHKIVSGLHTIALRPTKIMPMYLYFLLKTDGFKKFGRIVGTGMKVFGISYLNLIKYKFYCPSENEQLRDIDVLSDINNLIAANQRNQNKPWVLIPP